MPRTASLVAAGALSVVGAVIGTGLGRATIAEVNPAYYRNPDSAFYADLVPNARPSDDWEKLQAQEYQAAAQGPPPAACANCTWPIDPTPRQDPVIARYDERATPPPAPRVRARAEAPIEATVIEQPAEPDWAAVQRYSAYSVDRNGDATPAPAGDEGGGTQ
jgi:hypothetical protein